MIKQYTKDGRLIVAPTQAPDGWRTFLAGASDDPNAASKNGAGAPIRVVFTGPGSEGQDIVLAAPVLLHNGKVQREGAWDTGDRFSLSAKMGATDFDPGGNLDVALTEIAPGMGFWMPVEAGSGTHTFDSSKAIPVYESIPKAGVWGADQETGDVFPVGENAPFMLINFPVESFFARNIPLAADFESDADQSEWIHQRWILRLQVEKASPGAGSVAGILFTYRRSTT